MIALRHNAVGPDARVSLSNAARILGVSPQSVARWTRVGVRGVVLPKIRVGGRTFVLKSDLDAFIGAINTDPNQRKGPRLHFTPAGRRLAAAEAICERAGI